MGGAPGDTFQGVTPEGNFFWQIYSGVTRGRTAPGDTIQGGDTRRKKKFVGKFTKNSGETRSNRQKRCGVTPWRGDTRVKAIKSDSDSDSDEQKKVARFFRKKIEG